MVENIVFICVGICFNIVGVFNCFGYIFSIHRYNRRNVTESEKKPYGILMGIGTIIMGCSIVISAVIELIIENESVYFGILGGLVVGLIFMLIAQIKYNKSIF